MFSKDDVVVAIQSKQEGDGASGILNKMDKTPQIIHTDDEGALKTEAMQKQVNEQILNILLQGLTRIPLNDL